MLRSLLFVFLLLVLGAAALAATVTVNGKTVTVPVIEKDGKAYVDVVALMKLLGGTATYDAKTHKITVASGGGSVGTSEMPGQNAILEKVYSLGKQYTYFFRLKSAEYTTEQVVIGDRMFVPNANEKLLLLHFTVQNPTKAELTGRGDFLKFTVVDALNENHEGINMWGITENRTLLAQNLKPAQTVNVYSVIIVPAKGQMPKLMVIPAFDEKGTPVLRYNLLEKVVAPLPASIADPADPTGATALETVPGKVDTAYPYKNFDLTVKSFAYTTDDLGAGAPKDGAKYLVVTLLVKNENPRATTLRYDMITPTLTSTDKDKLKYRGMLLATANRACALDMKPAEEMTVRLYFDVLKDITPKTLTLKEGTSRSYEFEVKE